LLLACELVDITFANSNRQHIWRRVEIQTKEAQGDACAFNSPVARIEIFDFLLCSRRGTCTRADYRQTTRQSCANQHLRQSQGIGLPPLTPIMEDTISVGAKKIKFKKRFVMLDAQSLHVYVDQTKKELEDSLALLFCFVRLVLFFCFFLFFVFVFVFFLLRLVFRTARPDAIRLGSQRPNGRQTTDVSDRCLQQRARSHTIVRR
jgi:hypothetical protein